MTVVILALCVPVSTNARSEASVTEAAVIEMVQQASEAIAKHGLDEAIRQTDKSTWIRVTAGLYVFVLDIRGTLQLHPQVAMVGRNIRGTRDVHGDPFIERIMRASGKPGAPIWTEYFWPDPVDGHIRQKRVYSKRVGNLIVNCGYYLDQA